MARYATTEEQYLCDVCDALLAVREMSAKVPKDAPNGDTNYYCPRCDAHLLATNKYGLFMRVYRLRKNIPYIRTDGIDEPIEIEGL